MGDEPPSFTVFAPEASSLSFSVTVPANASPGDDLPCTTPDGRELNLVVPDGVLPGSILTLTQDPDTGKWSCSAEGCPNPAEDPSASLTKPEADGSISFTIVVPDDAVPGAPLQHEMDGGRILNFAVPDGVSPGTVLLFTKDASTNSWSCEVAPTEKSSNEVAKTSTSPSETVKPLTASVVIPPDAKPGTSLQCTVPDGRTLDVVVPEGVPPGYILKLEQDPHTKAWSCEAEPPPAEATPTKPQITETPLSTTVVVPYGAEPGSSLPCLTPDGAELSLVLPPGVPPGSTLRLTQNLVTQSWDCTVEELGSNEQDAARGSSDSPRIENHGATPKATTPTQQTASKGGAAATANDLSPWPTPPVDTPPTSPSFARQYPRGWAPEISDNCLRNQGPTDFPRSYAPLELTALSKGSTPKSQNVPTPFDPVSPLIQEVPAQFFNAHTVPSASSPESSPAEQQQRYAFFSDMSAELMQEGVPESPRATPGTQLRGFASLTHVHTQSPTHMSPRGLAQLASNFGNSPGVRERAIYPATSSNAAFSPPGQLNAGGASDNFYMEGPANIRLDDLLKKTCSNEADLGSKPSLNRPASGHSPPRSCSPPASAPQAKPRGDEPVEPPIGPSSWLQSAMGTAADFVTENLWMQAGSMFGASASPSALRGSRRPEVSPHGLVAPNFGTAHPPSCPRGDLYEEMADVPPDPTPQMLATSQGPGGRARKKSLDERPPSPPRDTKQKGGTGSSQVTVWYCQAHNSSAKRPKGEYGRVWECRGCNVEVNTNYKEFAFCQPCSQKEKRCMVCGEGASSSSQMMVKPREAETTMHPSSVPPRYCSMHSSSEKRTKVNAPKFWDCTSCGRQVTTNYSTFTLCPPCSDKDRRCMICGTPALEAGNYVPPCTLNQSCSSSIPSETPSAVNATPARTGGMHDQGQALESTTPPEAAAVSGERITMQQVLSYTPPPIDNADADAPAPMPTIEGDTSFTPLPAFEESFATTGPMPMGFGGINQPQTPCGATPFGGGSLTVPNVPPFGMGPAPDFGLNQGQQPSWMNSGAPVFQGGSVSTPSGHNPGFCFASGCQGYVPPLGSTFGSGNGSFSLSAAGQTSMGSSPAPLNGRMEGNPQVAAMQAFFGTGQQGLAMPLHQVQAALPTQSMPTQPLVGVPAGNQFVGPCGTLVGAPMFPRGPAFPGPNGHQPQVQQGWPPKMVPPQPFVGHHVLNGGRPPPPMAMNLPPQHRFGG